MKKLYSILFALFVAIFFTSVLGCGKDLREQFTEACQNQDFELAHQILEKYEYRDYDVFDRLKDAAMLLEREGTYLLENNTEADTEKLKVLILETQESSYRDKVLKELFSKASIMKNSEMIKFFMKFSDYHFFGDGYRYLLENGTEEELLYIATKIKSDDSDNFNNAYSEVFTKCLKSGYFSTAKEMIELLETTKHTKLIPIYKKQYDRETKK